MILTKDQKAKIFDRLFEEYIAEHGLGGMAKADFDALFLWLIVREQEKIDIFNISTNFKITESRIRSLLEKAAVKFDQESKEDVFKSILVNLEVIEFDIESLEKGQIRYQFKNPMHYRWLQEEVRKLGSTSSYLKASEQVTMNLDTMYRLLDVLWKDGELWTGAELEDQQLKIQKIIGHIGLKIESNSLEQLREAKKPKLEKMIKLGSTLVGIGEFIVPLVEKILENN